jgi:hypothetical protein
MGEAFDAACNELHDKGQPTVVYDVRQARPPQGAVGEVVGIGRGAFSGNMRVSFQAARSIG